MANNKLNVSPSVNFTESDNTFATLSNSTVTKLGLVGEFKSGPAFKTVAFADYETFSSCYGKNDPCYFPGTQDLKYEANYIAKEFLSESDEMHVCRVLGLSGYDAGDAYAFTFGSAIDPNSVIIKDTVSFSGQANFSNGVLVNGTFDNYYLQLLYNNGKIDKNLFQFNATTGDTINMTNQFYGDCETYKGARFTSVVNQVDENMICITGTTMTSSGQTSTVSSQNCTVLYSGGSITYDSTFVISVVNPIAIINQSSNEITLVTNGTVQMVGGTINHYTDGSVIIINGNITLPDGTILSGGQYKICSLENNNSVYLCDNGFTTYGDNILITTGQTSTNVTTFTTGETITSAQIPSGLKIIYFSGEVVTMDAIPIAETNNTLIATLRSHATIDSDEFTKFEIQGNTVTISPINVGEKIKPYDDFNLIGMKVNGDVFSYTVSFDRSKKSYIGRVFGKNPQICCPQQTPFYIDELFVEMFDAKVTSGEIDCIKPMICYTSALNNYKQEYSNAITPWVLSEVRGNQLFRLFKFHSFSDGDIANEQFKVSITNVKPDSGTFTVEVRAFNDTDKNPVILERYSNLTMNEADNNFIGKAMGTLDECYEQKSKYVLVEMGQNCLADSFPCGFEGYTVRDLITCKLPKINYKNEYGTFDRPRNVYLGISDTVGIEKDLFAYKGLDISGLEWTSRTDAFHLDKDAVNCNIVGTNINYTFQTSALSFKNDTELVGTMFNKVSTRRFTLCVAGGFDGWDIHRKSRTNTDQYVINGLRANKGLLSGAFDTIATTEGESVLNSDYYAFSKGIRTFSNPETVKVNLFATAGLFNLDHSNLIEETIEMIEEERCDMFYVIGLKDYDTDFKPILPDDLGNRLDGLFETSWAAAYAYGGKIYDEENNIRVSISPVGNVVKVFARVDRVAKPFFAPAGTKRGLTSYIVPRYKPTQSERDTLYQYRINPMITDQGNVYLFGNRTLQSAENGSVLNLVNVRRLMILLREKIADVSINLLFEKNDAQVRSDFRNAVTPILQNFVTERGIFSYEIKLDSSVNALNSTELNGKIYITPIRDLETINIDFSLDNTGADFTS